MRVAPLPARAVEDSGTAREAEDLDQPRDLLPVTREREQRLVLAQILLVEVVGPPF